MARNSPSPRIPFRVTRQPLQSSAVPVMSPTQSHLRPYHVALRLRVLGCGCIVRRLSLATIAHRSGWRTAAYLHKFHALRINLIRPTSRYICTKLVPRGQRSTFAQTGVYLRCAPCTSGVVATADRPRLMALAVRVASLEAQYPDALRGMPSSWSRYCGPTSYC